MAASFETPAFGGLLRMRSKTPIIQSLMVRSASRRQVYVACVNLATMRVSGRCFASPWEPWGNESGGNDTSEPEHGACVGYDVTAGWCEICSAAALRRQSRHRQSSPSTGIGRRAVSSAHQHCPAISQVNAVPHREQARRRGAGFS